MLFHHTGNFLVSQWLHPLINGLSNNELHALMKSCWWMHIIGIFAFLNYLPYSKHLHILLAFPNAYYARLWPEGKIRNMKYRSAGSTLRHAAGTGAHRCGGAGKIRRQGCMLT